MQPYSDGGQVSWSAIGRQQQSRPHTSDNQQRTAGYSSGYSGSYGSSYSYSYAGGSGGRGGSYAYSYNESRGGRVSSSSYQYASNYQGTSGGRRGSGGGSHGRGYGRAPVGRGNGGPPAAAQPPMWRKEGDALLPLPNSTLASAYAEARSARLAAAGPAPTAIIMRGLPGAGKSSRAAELAAEAAAQGSSCAVHSTDSFFVDAATGRYVFDPTMLSANHERNRTAFTASLAAGTLLVIVDNTNLQRWQYEPYVKAAWLAGYEVRKKVVCSLASTTTRTSVWHVAIVQKSAASSSGHCAQPSYVLHVKRQPMSVNDQVCRARLQSTVADDHACLYVAGA